jgi:diguanylate cyclase (GGDEF)-like protein
VCLALLDLDNFRIVNEQHGHASGDEVLRVASRALAQSVRGQDLVSRLGGDEFSVLLANVPSLSAGAIVERIRRSMEVSRPGLPRVTASAGFASAIASDSPARLFDRADAALRRAKSAGRNCTVSSDGRVR